MAQGGAGPLLEKEPDNFTNEEAIRFLLKLEEPGCPLPSNVIKDVDPRCYRPENLSLGSWYLVVKSREEIEIQNGCWKLSGSPCNVVFSKPELSGCRTDLQFFEGPDLQETIWMMHEFNITRDGSKTDVNVKDSSFLCRVLKRVDGTEKHNVQGSTSAYQEIDNPAVRVIGIEILPNNPAEDLLGHISTGNYIELADLTDHGPPSSSNSKDIDNPAVHVVEEVDYEDYIRRGDYLSMDDLPYEPPRSSNSNEIDNPAVHVVGEVDYEDYIRRGDYLSMDDLLYEPPRSSNSNQIDNPAVHVVGEENYDDYRRRGDYLGLEDLIDEEGSLSSRSENSSCMTKSSGECFDSLTLLQDNDLNQGNIPDGAEVKDTNCDLSIPASTRSENIALETATPSDGNGKSPNHASADENCSTAMGGASSGGHSSDPEGSKKGGGKRMKKMRRMLKKKYLCFMPFFL